MKSRVKRMFTEALGWILTAIGAYFIFEDNTSFIHYVLLIVGILIIIVNFPFKDFSRKKS
ncbi:hypothetical protein QGM71_05185 [Virgibacillus sp. C22-A2]|uniref:Uncharacterized protein n=1 Tax=Virgibacillus tibetensis TaxID=3042313 RepID=A0ABU6KC46_9BACI|nr:hypothetical protein [Virgibacillus sp. C22-A2]